MQSFPLPDFTNGFAYFQSDALFQLVPAHLQATVYRKAWLFGKKAADDSVLTYQSDKNLAFILHDNGISVTRIKADKVACGIRFFGEYSLKHKCIFLYTDAIEKYAEHNQIPYDKAENIVLAHEYFHYLEDSCYGSAAGLYEVPRISIGKHQFGKRGLPILSEIAASAFAYVVAC